MQTSEEIPGHLLRPEIMTECRNYAIFRAGMRYNRTLKDLEAGKYIIAEGSFATALSLYSWIKKKTGHEYPVYDHSSSRANRRIFSERSGRILIRVKDHNPVLDKAPSIPWLKSFYRRSQEFMISLPDLLGMNGAWQWYSKGVKYQVLNHKLHPFYGVYFPTRTTHLMMLDDWLARNMKGFGLVADIGTGCGVLGFMAVKHGARAVYATDINPNAIYSTSMDAYKTGLGKRINSIHGSFFGAAKDMKSADNGLVLFNPPWIPGKCNTLIDKGIYYEDGFFDEFFELAAEKVRPGSFIAVIFSDYAIVAGVAKRNPVEEAVKANHNFVVVDKLTKKVQEKTGKLSRSWINSIRENETTELLIIKRS